MQLCFEFHHQDVFQNILPLKLSFCISQPLLRQGYVLKSNMTNDVETIVSKHLRSLIFYGNNFSYNRFSNFIQWNDPLRKKAQLIIQHNVNRHFLIKKGKIHDKHISTCFEPAAIEFLKFVLYLLDIKWISRRPTCGCATALMWILYFAAIFSSVL